jgi:hypothetical protein
METGQKITQLSSNIDKLSNIELSIQVSLNGLSFCILNIKANTIEFYKSILFSKKLTPYTLLEKLKHCFNIIAELKQPFSKLNVVHENELSALVPKTLFDEDSIADYLKFNSRILQSDYITYDNVIANDSVNVYVPYVNINNYLYETFGAFEYKHFSSVLLENLLANEKNSEELKMYVHVANKHFEIIVIESGKLLLYNSFELQTKEDLIYYILFITEQLNLNPETFKLILLGTIQKNDEYYNIVYKYVRNVSNQNITTTYNISETLKSKIDTNYIILNSF